MSDLSPIPYVANDRFHLENSSNLGRDLYIAPRAIGAIAKILEPELEDVLNFRGNEESATTLANYDIPLRAPQRSASTLYRTLLPRPMSFAQASVMYENRFNERSIQQGLLVLRNDFDQGCAELGISRDEDSGEVVYSFQQSEASTTLPKGEIEELTESYAYELLSTIALQAQVNPRDLLKAHLPSDLLDLLVRSTASLRTKRAGYVWPEEEKGVTAIDIAKSVKNVGATTLTALNIRILNEQSLGDNTGVLLTQVDFTHADGRNGAKQAKIEAKIEGTSKDRLSTAERDKVFDGVISNFNSKPKLRAHLQAAVSHLLSPFSENVTYVIPE